ncbi:hypothetical protein AYL99_10774 [Fonsecaea erecta]|uniref:Uncharacterized protein n=1 Tax=Fonsecaea erecta TaxID=1367422 RepID=A0A178Z5M8_9EURO|nr:hypothetical protein AYL99_10774 [Fonsecaea erecta]OAP55074.1 hypothetical protein AYL99_10774 [Fonsecaea erecta]
MCRLCGRVVKCIFDILKSVYYDQADTRPASVKLLRSHLHGGLNISNHPCIQQSFASHPKCVDSKTNYYIAVTSSVIVLITPTVAAVEDVMPFFLYDTNTARLSEENGYIQSLKTSPETATRLSHAAKIKGWPGGS